MSENVGKVFNINGGQSQSGVPVTRKINGKPLAADITLTASDVGAAESGHTHTPSEIGAAVSGHTHTAAEVGAVPTARTVNGKALSSNVTLSAADVGAATSGHTHTPASIGAATSGHTHTAADVGALPVSGGTLTGNLTIKGSSNYGTKINLGDGDYVHIAEPTDDCLEIKAKKINFVTSATTDDKFTLNGEPIGGGGSTVSPATETPKTAGTATVGTSNKYAREDHIHGAQTSVSGNAGTATKLATARTIEGMSFNGSAAITNYGTCSTASTIAAKTVSKTGFSLVTGARIAVKFTHANEAENPTLNVNSTGAKPIMMFGTMPGRYGIWGAGRIVEFIYDGTNWVMLMPSFAEGIGTNPSGACSHAEGCNAVASGLYSHAEGMGTDASGFYQHVSGMYNIPSNFGTDTDKLIIGKGTNDTARANCFRVTHTGVYATGAHNSSGADYAELFEWADGNPDGEDRVGRFVTLDGEQIRLAGSGDDFILGIVSGNPSVVGDVHDDQWQGMYLYDIFGRPLWEDVEVPDQTMELPDPEHPGETITRVVVPAHMEHRQKLNPDYDGTQPYQPRTQRSEWDAVGMLGKLVATDDGTCLVNGWCTVGEGGIATHSAERTRYRVMARLDETHVRVLIV